MIPPLTSWPMAAFRALVTCLSLAFAPAAFALNASWNAPTDIPVTANGYVATGQEITFDLNFAPTVGTDLTVVKNTASAFIAGSFAGLSQGQSVELEYDGKIYTFVADYFGGSGNDLVLVWKHRRAYGWGFNNDFGQLGDGTTSRRTMPVPVRARGVLEGKTILSVAAGVQHSLVLCSDGTVAAWGWNDYGQLGDNTVLSSLTPVAVDTTPGVSAIAGKRVVAIAAGGGFSLALCSDGTVAGWGNNWSGQLGDNSQTNRLVPVAVNTTAGLSALHGKEVVSIAAGGGLALALCSDGTVATWGAILTSATTSTTQQTVPIVVDASTPSSALHGRTVVSVAAGGTHCLALCSDGTIASWGYNDNGELGDGTTTDRVIPVQVQAVDATSALFGRTVTSIAAGPLHSLAVCTDGSIASWGQSYLGALGIDTSLVFIPVPVLADAESAGSALRGRAVVSAGAGLDQSLYLCSDGTLVRTGQGADFLSTTKVPIAIPTPADERTVRISVGVNWHTLMIMAGPLAPDIELTGNGVAIHNGDLAPTEAKHTDFGAVEVGGGTMTRVFTITNAGELDLHLTAKPRVVVTGMHAGDFVVTRQPASVVTRNGGTTSFEVTFAAGGPWLRTATVTVGSDDETDATFSFEVQGTGRGLLAANHGTTADVPLEVSNGFVATGSTVEFLLNHEPQTGAELMVVRNTGPGLIEGTFDNLAQGQIVVLSHGGEQYDFVANYRGGNGNDLVLVWKKNRVVSWGNNLDDQLGDGTAGGWRTTPALLPDMGALAGKTVIGLSAGYTHSLALCSDGTLVAWGANEGGQLGDGTTINRLAPVAVDVSLQSALFGKRVVAVAAGIWSSLALCADGTLAAWGAEEGWPPRLLPTPLTFNPQRSALFGKTVVSIASANHHTLALCSDGTVATWRRNGAAAMPTAINVEAGVSALFGKRVVSIAAGAGASGFSMALCSDGTVAVWGEGGWLGDNSWSSRPDPVPINVEAGGSALAGKTVVEVSASHSHSLALCSDGSIAAWGSGQLGDGTDGPQRLSPVHVNSDAPSSALAGRSASRIAAGGGHSLALCADGAALAWGSNFTGTLGDGTTTDRLVPTLVNTTTLPARERIALLASGPMASHTLAALAAPYEPIAVVRGKAVDIRNGDDLPDRSDDSEFGLTAMGEPIVRTFTIVNLGDRTLNLTGTPPVQVTGAHSGDFLVTRQPAAEVARDGGTTTFEITFSPSGPWLRAATVVVDCNDPSNSTYQFAIQGSVRGSLSAEYADAAATPVIGSSFIATGSTIGLALQHAPAAGSTLTVVRNTGMDFIEGNFDNLVHGQAVELQYGANTYYFRANYFGGSGNDLVLEWENRRAVWWMWDRNPNGPQGDGSDPKRFTPIPVSTAGVLTRKTVLRLSAGGSHRLALCSDGTVAAWGDNNRGQLGDGGPEFSGDPVAVNTDVEVSALAGKTVVAVAAGSAHSLALCSDGTVVAWGDNNRGQLGDNSTTERALPVRVNTDPGISFLHGRKVVAIAASSNRSLALCSDGTVASWGDNYFFAEDRVPAVVSAEAGASALFGKRVVGIAAGRDHSLALCSDGTLVAWGKNTYGQLGDNSDTYRSLPVAVDTTMGVSALHGKIVTAVSAGGDHSLALCSDGTVVAWGDGGSGQLGNDQIERSFVPVTVNADQGVSALFGRTVVEIVCGPTHCLALCTDGSAAAWGWIGGFPAALGYYNSFQQKVPVLVTRPGLSGVQYVELFQDGGGGQFLAVVATPFASEMEVAGDGLEILDADRTPSLADGTDFGATEVGSEVVRAFTLANTGDADLRLTGSPKVAISGPHASEFTVTRQPDALLPRFGDPSGFEIAFKPAGPWLRTATVVVTNDDADEDAFQFEIQGTGRGVLSAGFFTGAEVPLVVSDGFVATGSMVNVTLEFPPTPGTGLMVVQNTGPGFLKGTFDNLAQGQAVDLMFGGATHSFVANYFGGTGNDLVLMWKSTQAHAWGSNSDGQLGIETALNRVFPAPVGSSGILDGKVFTCLEGGERHSLALTLSGEVVAWGSNQYGQIGRDSTNAKSSPALVSSASGSSGLFGRTAIAIAAGQFHSLALCSDGRVVAWGRGSEGQLGDGGGTNRPAPRLVTDVAEISALAGRTVVAIAAGNSHSLALCSDGVLTAWGSNSHGQLGDGTLRSRGVPTKVNAVRGVSALHGRKVVAIAAGSIHSLALFDDGTLAAWGGNAFGQLGEGSTADSHVPVAVDSASQDSWLFGRRVVAVAAGHSHAVVMCSDGTLAAWGANAHGQLGDGTTIDRLRPVPVNFSAPPQILLGRTVTSIAAGPTCSMALSADGLLSAWGENSAGQLGDGTTVSRLTPVAVKTSPLRGGAGWSGVLRAARGDHALAIGPPGTALEIWRYTWFQTMTDTGDAALFADPDSDGLVNLVEWGCALDPTRPGALLSTLSMSGGEWGLVYRRGITAWNAGVGFIVEWSRDLASTSWNPIASGGRVLSADTVAQQVRVSLPAGDWDQRFVRVRITAP